jgi:hypothetical protein
MPLARGKYAVELAHERDLTAILDTIKSALFAGELNTTMLLQQLNFVQDLLVREIACTAYTSLNTPHKSVKSLITPPTQQRVDQLKSPLDAAQRVA